MEQSSIMRWEFSVGFFDIWKFCVMRLPILTVLCKCRSADESWDSWMETTEGKLKIS